MSYKVQATLQDSSSLSLASVLTCLILTMSSSIFVPKLGSLKNVCARVTISRALASAVLSFPPQTLFKKRLSYLSAMLTLKQQIRVLKKV